MERRGNFENYDGGDRSGTAGCSAAVDFAVLGARRRLGLEGAAADVSGSGW